MLRCYSLLCYYYDITFNYLEKWVWSQNVKIMQCLSITVTLSIITSCYFHVIISPRSIYLYFKRQNKTTFEIGLRFNRKQHAIRFWRDPWNQMDKNKKSFPRQTFSTIMCLSVRLLSRMSRISGAGLLVTNSPSLYSLLSGTTSNLRSSHFKRTKKKKNEHRFKGRRHTPNFSKRIPSQIQCGFCPVGYVVFTRWYKSGFDLLNKLSFDSN